MLTAQVAESPDHAPTNKRLNEVLALLVKAGEHPVTIGNRLMIREKDVRNRVTLDTADAVHSDPEDFRKAALHIEESLRGQVTPTNFGAAPLLRVASLMKRMAREYERAQAHQASQPRKAGQHG
jgi:hypothetical protein